MNAQQRRKNRETAAYLEHIRHTCPECGERGKHWISIPRSIDRFLSGYPSEGFWTRPNLYDKTTGRRLEP